MQSSSFRSLRASVSGQGCFTKRRQIHIWCSAKDATIEVAENKCTIEWSTDYKIYRR